MTDEPTKRSGKSALTLAWVPIAYAVVELRSAISTSPYANLDLYCLGWLVLFRRPTRCVSISGNILLSL